MIDLFQAQSIFRLLLRAMARPGSVVELSDLEIYSPARNKYPFLILFTLLDHEVGFAVLDSKANADDKALSEYISANTASRDLSIEEADFVLIFGGASKGALWRMRRGSLEYPDESATILCDVERIEEGFSPQSLHLELSGPGIPSRRTVSIEGADQDLFVELAEVNQEFPLGVDAIFSDRMGRVVCLPRSTEVKL